MASASALSVRALLHLGLLAGGLVLEVQELLVGEDLPRCGLVEALGRREELLLVDAPRSVVVERGLELLLDHLEADGERSIATLAANSPQERGLKQVVTQIRVVLAEVDGLLVAQNAHEAARAQPVEGGPRPR